MMDHIQEVEIILFVANQEMSTVFYEKILRALPQINVLGMTEFQISAYCKLGLMPNHGIEKILGKELPSPSIGVGIPRCELYLMVENLQLEFENAINCGAKLISPILERDWGHRACYFSDLDGHIIAFAEKIS